MRSLFAVLAVFVTGALGGVLGCSAGVAMDRFRGLGLGPEEFWHTDPENVWAWGAIVGAAIGIAVGIAVAVRRWPKRKEHHPEVQHSG